MKKRKYIWVTVVPMVFVTVTTLTAAAEMIGFHYWPKSASPFMIHVNVTLILIMVGCSFVIFAGAFRKWIGR